jgi:pimeloyl-ACP methyl ester carboxylesterase
MKSRFALALCCWLLVLPGSGRAEEGSFDSGGIKIHYIVEGRGEPVLLIHGFTVNIERQWGDPGIIRELARDYRVIALDNRGHGKSDKPHDPKQYGTEMVEDAVRLLDHLKIDKAHVVGYSMGATITLKLLATHPDRLLSATLGGSGGIREGGVPPRYEVLAESLEQGKGFGPLILALTPAGRPKPTDEQIKEINERLTAANDTKALAAVVRGLKDLAVSDDKLKANRVPTLALIGGIDPLKKSVDDLKGRLADLRVVVLDGEDHITAFSRPEFVKELRDFLGKQGPKVERGQADLYRKLNLSDAQVAAVAKVRAEADARVRELEEKVKAVREAEEAEVEKVLTDEQRARLKELRGGAPARGSFSLSGTLTPNPVKRGATATLSLTQRRTPDFKGGIKLTVPVLPKGWKVAPEAVTIEPGDGKVDLKVTVDRNTPAGEHTLTIRALSGDTVAELRVTIKVEP